MRASAVALEAPRILRAPSAPGHPGPEHLAPVPGKAPSALGDLRFRALMRDEEWAALPASIRRRFSKRLAAGATIVFRSKDYFLQLFGRRFFLPNRLSPGALYVTHAELPDRKFSFTLQVIHPRLGLLIRQMAIFREVGP